MLHSEDILIGSSFNLRTFISPICKMRKFHWNQGFLNLFCVGTPFGSLLKPLRPSSEKAFKITEGNAQFRLDTSENEGFFFSFKFSGSVDMLGATEPS